MGPFWLLAVYCGLRFESLYLDAHVETTQSLAPSISVRRQGLFNPPEGLLHCPALQESLGIPCHPRVGGVPGVRQHGLEGHGTTAPNHQPGRPCCSTAQHQAAPAIPTSAGSWTVARGRLRTHPGMCAAANATPPEESHKYGVLAPLQGASMGGVPTRGQPGGDPGLPSVTPPGSGCTGTLTHSKQRGPPSRPEDRTLRIEASPDADGRFSSPSPLPLSPQAGRGVQIPIHDAQNSPPNANVGRAAK